MNRASETDELPFLVPVPEKLRGLLKDVSKFIVQHPDQFDMNDWVNPFGTSCGTVGCIAGHMALKDTPKKLVLEALKRDLANFQRDLDKKYARKSDVKKYSSNIRSLVEYWVQTNIPYEFQSNFGHLFYPGEIYWEKFKTKTGKITPKLAAAHIEQFLQTGE